VVRPAEPQDVPAIWKLINALAIYEKLADSVVGSAEAMHHWLFEEPLVYCLVKIFESQVVGYAIYFRTFSTFRTEPGIWLEDIFVTPEHRGLGFGKELIQSVIADGKRRSFARLEWSVLDWNQPAIDFYHSLGATVMPDWRICRFDLTQ
jgi:GNAT superfamily N-acetyltransferase